MARTQETEAPGLSGEQFERLIAALTARASDSLDKTTLKEILTETAQISATSMQKALKPENEAHPGISSFSYPEGDVARPRPTLPYEFLWNNYPVHKFPETQHWRELELMCQVQPGEYTVLRRDGSKMAVTVKAERNADGAITRLSVEFPINRDEKALVPPMAVVLYQLVHPDNPKQRFVEAMTEYLKVVVAA